MRNLAPELYMAFVNRFVTVLTADKGCKGDVSWQDSTAKATGLKLERIGMDEARWW